MNTIFGPSTGAACLAVASLLGCDASTTRPIAEGRTATVAPRPARANATSDERFSMRGHGAAPSAPERTGEIAFDTPSGWTLKADPSGMRLASFGLPSDPEGDCSVTVLPGTPDAVLPNVDRWRKQMGLGPLDPAELAKLPQVAILGGTGRLIEIEGAYSGMGGGEGRPGWVLLGAIGAIDLAKGPSLVFVKMVGPKAAVEAERGAFVGLCASLRRGGGDAPADDDHAGHDHPPGQGHGESPFIWKVPAGWAPAASSSARIVTFRVGPRQDAECYVAVLGGTGGGVAANVNRWRTQMGQAPLDDAGLAALPRLKLLGRDSPLVEASGTFTDMQGAEHRGAMLLGALVQLGEYTVFVKMVGPEADVGAERERFAAFCASLEVRQ